VGESGGFEGDGFRHSGRLFPCFKIHGRGRLLNF
jgi:hypothetical protein